jgi:MarR family transcriptional regulator for hemolysin
MTQRLDNLRTITSQLLRLARVYRREVNRAMNDLGLSDARALPVLLIARSGGGMRQGALAEEMGIEGPSLVPLLDQLCAAGLVERATDPSDRRAKTLHPTDEGRRMAALIEDMLVGVRDRLLGAANDADVEATVRVFAVLDAALDGAEARGGV